MLNKCYFSLNFAKAICLSKVTKANLQFTFSIPESIVLLCSPVTNWFCIVVASCLTHRATRKVDCIKRFQQKQIQQETHWSPRFCKIMMFINTWISSLPICEKRIEHVFSSILSAISSQSSSSWGNVLDATCCRPSPTSTLLVSPAIADTSHVWPSVALWSRKSQMAVTESWTFVWFEMLFLFV